jgi:uncharacterized membrane protein
VLLNISEEKMPIKTTGLFLASNIILIGVGWMAALFAYPRLPDKVPLWLNFFGNQVFLQKKSPLFFIYAATQTVFCVLFILATRFVLNRHRKHLKENPRRPKNNKDVTDLFGEELALLALIFFNLVFIHIQTSLIYLSYNLGRGFHPYYFIMIFLVILLLIPYYRLRIKMVKKPEQVQ